MEKTRIDHLAIQITQGMVERAVLESNNRREWIRHHFLTSHYAQSETDALGFIGEFCFRILLDIPWQLGIRSNYETIDESDVAINGWSIDVKTESVPSQGLLQRIVTQSIGAAEPYGCRLVHEGQIQLLGKYDIVFFGAVRRTSSVAELAAWYPIGWISAGQVSTYPHGTEGPKRPSGSRIIYPFPAYQVPNRDLRIVSELINVIRYPK